MRTASLVNMLKRKLLMSRMGIHLESQNLMKRRIQSQNPNGKIYLVRMMSTIQETDLSQVLAALIARDEIHAVLSNPIPSAKHIVNDAEGLSVALHQDCVRHEAPRARPAILQSSSLLQNNQPTVTSLSLPSSSQPTLSIPTNILHSIFKQPNLHLYFVQPYNILHSVFKQPTYLSSPATSFIPSSSSQPTFVRPYNILDAIYKLPTYSIKTSNSPSSHL
ncbi:hypothetical protein OS493_028529 [Desmophyllum pertusum]|uniref:Uncharacterized protein n=1 Tax=Desmophyllum pertusum TaxID=174260 RepID=A0A9X0CVX8_9CNID|nr:hypothetical protein OS493_028529 [Desmophyllum pertusum]